MQTLQALHQAETILQKYFKSPTKTANPPNIPAAAAPIPPHLQPQVKPPILPIKPEPTPLKKPFIPPTTTTTPETPKKMIPSQPQPKIEPHPKVIPIPGKPPNVQQALNQFVDRICVPETHSM